MPNFVCNKCGKDNFKDKYAYSRHMNRKTTCVNDKNQKAKRQQQKSNSNSFVNNEGNPNTTASNNTTNNTIPININAGENPNPKLSGIPGLDFIGTVPGLEGLAKMLGVPININPNSSINNNPSINVKFNNNNNKTNNNNNNVSTNKNGINMDKKSVLEFSKRMLVKQLIRGEVNIRPLNIYLEKFLDSKVGSEDNQETIKFDKDPLVEVLDILSYHEPDIEPDSPIFGKEMTRRDNYLLKSMNFITKRLFKYMIMQDSEPFRGVNIVVDDDSILMLNNTIVLYKNLLDMINYQNATRELNLELKKYETMRYLDNEDDCLSTKMETLIGDIVLSQYSCVSDFLFDFEHMILESRKRPDHDFPGFKPLTDEEVEEMKLVYQSLRLNESQINKLDKHFKMEREVHMDYEGMVNMPPHPERPIRKSKHTEIMEQKRLQEEEEERMYQEELEAEAKSLGITKKEVEEKRTRERRERLAILRENHKKRMEEREREKDKEIEAKTYNLNTPTNNNKSNTTKASTNKTTTKGTNGRKGKQTKDKKN